MSIQVIGYTGTVANVDGATFKALRVTSRAVEYGGLGIYRISMLSGTIAGNHTNADIFQARWTDPTRLALIWGVSLNGFGSGGGAVGTGFGNINVLVARNWTVDGSGGSAATLSGNNQKIDTSMGSTLMNAIRISTTGDLTAGTKTLDLEPIGQVAMSLANLSNNVFIPGITELYGSLEPDSNPAPVVLTQNEGIVCQMTTPGGGNWQLGFTMSWAEVVSY